MCRDRPQQLVLLSVRSGGRGTSLALPAASNGRPNNRPVRCAVGPNVVSVFSGFDGCGPRGCHVRRYDVTVAVRCGRQQRQAPVPVSRRRYPVMRRGPCVAAGWPVPSRSARPARRRTPPAPARHPLPRLRPVRAPVGRRSGLGHVRSRRPVPLTRWPAAAPRRRGGPARHRRRRVGRPVVPGPGSTPTGARLLGVLGGGVGQSRGAV